MSKYIIKFLSFLADSLSLLEIMNKYIIKFLYFFNFLLGKGYGSNSIRQEIKLVSKFTIPQEVKLCIDVGGNKGKYSEGLKKTFPNSKIIIFEPQHKCFELLQEKFRDQDNVQLIPKALSNFDGKSIIYSDKQGSGLASLTKRNLEHVNVNFETTENVEVTNFFKFWKENLNSIDIDVVKIDVEGHEMDVLLGMGEAIEKIKIIQFEFGGCNIDTRTYFIDYFEFFKKHKFNLFRISPIGLIGINAYSEFDEFFSTTNFIAVSTEMN